MNRNEENRFKAIEDVSFRWFYNEFRTFFEFKEFLNDGNSLSQEEDEDDEDDEEDSHLYFDDPDEEDCYEDTCVEEAYPGVRNVGLLGKVVKTLSYLTRGNQWMEMKIIWVL